MRRIVIFCPNWVGDAVMATPTLRAVRERFPDAQISGLMLRSIADTLAGNPWLDDYLILEDFGTGFSRWMRVAQRLRRERFDLALLMTNNLLSAAVARWGGVRRRVGYAREGRGFLLTDRLRADWRPWSYRPTPLIDYYLGLVKALGPGSVSRQMELFVDDGDASRSAQLFRSWGIRPGEPTVVLNPGAAFGPAKRWSVEAFAELARRLVDRERCRVVVLCGPAERELAREIVQQSERCSAVFSLADEKVSIGLSKAVVARASVLVSTDSGPRHFAPSLGVPVVALFGPTHVEWTETYYPAETKLQKVVPCGPCQQRECPLGHHRCMKELSVSEVYEATRARLRTSHVDIARRTRVA